jgi:hypothetical protein
MIKNLWKIAHFYCSYRHEPKEMQINDKGSHSLFYSCPKYYPENRTPDEQACPMRLNFVDAEAILNEISKKLDDESGFDCNDITGEEFDYKAIHVKVLKYTPERIDIDIYNKKAIK